MLDIVHRIQEIINKDIRNSMCSIYKETNITYAMTHKIVVKYYIHNVYSYKRLKFSFNCLFIICTSHYLLLKETENLVLKNNNFITAFHNVFILVEYGFLYNEILKLT